MLLNTCVQMAPHRDLACQCPWGRPYSGGQLVGPELLDLPARPSMERAFHPWRLCTLLTMQLPSIVPTHAPKLIRGSELPPPKPVLTRQTGHAAITSAQGRTTGTCQVCSFCSGSCGTLRVMDRAGIPAPAQFGLSTLTAQGRVPGSSQNHSHTLQQPSSAQEPHPLPACRWLWEDRMSWLLALF